MSKGYFEGWYFKQQATSGETLALIPGRADDGAFLQVVTNESSYGIPYSSCQYQRANPAWLEKNRFSLAGVKLDVEYNDITVKGCIRFTNPVPLGYDIMGPLVALPLECRHSVLSMNHELHGGLLLNGRRLDFTGGRGYIEGDRGTSFPDGYSWAQCNYFPFDASIMMAAARIPVGLAHVWGCTAVVWLGGRQYRIASYLGGRVDVREKTVLQLRQGGSLLSVEVPRADGHALAAPQNGGMVRTIHESPGTCARFRFVRHGCTMLDAESEFTSYEFVEQAAKCEQ